MADAVDALVIEVSGQGLGLRREKCAPAARNVACLALASWFRRGHGEDRAGAGGVVSAGGRWNGVRGQGAAAGGMGAWGRVSGCGRVEGEARANGASEASAASAGSGWLVVDEMPQRLEECLAAD